MPIFGKLWNSSECTISGQQNNFFRSGTYYWYSRNLFSGRTLAILWSSTAIPCLVRMKRSEKVRYSIHVVKRSTFLKSALNKTRYTDLDLASLKLLHFIFTIFPLKRHNWGKSCLIFKYFWKKIWIITPDEVIRKYFCVLENDTLFWRDFEDSLWVSFILRFRRRFFIF